MRWQLPAQLGGAAGTLAALGDEGPEVLRRYAQELGLREPVMPWHTQRAPLAELAAGLAAAAVAIEKIALDIVLLAQTEVGEVARGRRRRLVDDAAQAQSGRGASSRARAARHARANAAMLLECGVHEHERAAGAWHAEWAALTIGARGDGRRGGGDSRARSTG